MFHNPLRKKINGFRNTTLFQIPNKTMRKAVYCSQKSASTYFCALIKAPARGLQNQRYAMGAAAGLLRRVNAAGYCSGITRWVTENGLH